MFGYHMCITYISPLFSSIRCHQADSGFCNANSGLTHGEFLTRIPCIVDTEHIDEYKEQIVNIRDLDFRE